MKNNNWFWGIFFILSAVFVIATQTGSFVEVGVLSILATILLVALIIQSIVSVNFFGIFVPMAFLYMIYSQPLGLKGINTWLLVAAAILVSIGFSVIFKKRPKAPVCCNTFERGHFNQTNENIDDNNPSVKVNFSSSVKYLHADSLKSGQFTVSFGSLEIYFDKVQLDPAGAEIFLDCSFGAINLFVPKEWLVIDNMRASLGGVDDKKRMARPAENAPRLTITGNVQFGGIEIQYI